VASREADDEGVRGVGGYDREARRVMQETAEGVGAAHAFRGSWPFARSWA